ncbi:MAG: hypothetical protein R3E39_16795 [Anaerolineae bacterium]
MDTPIEQLTRWELVDKLLQAYASLHDTDAETEAIIMLKGELYRRGAEKNEIVTIALAGLFKQNLN